jgi:hypothetical protein
VFLVPLAPVPEPGGVPDALAAAIAAPRVAEMGPVAAMREALRDRHLLLVIYVTLVSSMCTHAHLLTLAGRGAEARACVAEAQTLYEPGDDPRVLDQLEGTIAFAAVVERNYAEAEQRLRECWLIPSAPTSPIARPAATWLTAHSSRVTLRRR